jgi:hypothetical protein
MNSRLVRQLIYGAVYLAIVLFIIIGIYLNNFKAAPSCFDEKRNQGEEEIDCGGPCQDCALRRLEPITTETELIPTGDMVSVVIRFTNPNIFYGSNNFSYTLTLHDSSGAEVNSINRSSLIYPGEFQKTIIEANIPTSINSIGFSPKVVLSGFDWISAEEFSRPETILRQRSFVVSESGSEIEASGIVILSRFRELTLAQLFTEAGKLLEHRKPCSKALSREVKDFSKL